MGEKNFTARTKTAFKFTVVYKNSAGAGIDLTTYTVKMDIKKADGTTVADLTEGSGITMANQTTNPGQFSVLVGKTATTSWPVETLYYDILVNPDANAEDAEAILWGTISVTAGVTT